MRFIDHFLTSPLFWSKLCNMASCIGSQHWKAGEVRMQSTDTLMGCHQALTVASLMSCTTAARCFSPNSLMSCAVRRCRAFPLGSGTPAPPVLQCLEPRGNNLLLNRIRASSDLADACACIMNGMGLMPSPCMQEA